jgi:hypothetical protein
MRDLADPEYAEMRRLAYLVQHHLAKAEGLRDALADDSGEMAEAKRNLVKLANEFGLFCDPIEPHSADGADPAATAPAN